VAQTAAGMIYVFANSGVAGLVDGGTTFIAQMSGGFSVSANGSFSFDDSGRQFQVNGGVVNAFDNGQLLNATPIPAGSKITLDSSGTVTALYADPLGFTNQTTIAADGATQQVCTAPTTPNATDIFLITRPFSDVCRIRTACTII